MVDENSTGRRDSIATGPESGSRKPKLAPGQGNALSTKYYTQAILAHSRRYVASSSFPGHNYTGLTSWLLHPVSGIDRQDHHSLVVLHDLGSEKSNRTRCFERHDACEFSSVAEPSTAQGQLIFVCGHPSPAWVAGLGSRYRIDPELFCRHLDFQDGSINQGHFSMPSLKSTTSNIVHINVSTILAEPFGARPSSGISAARRAVVAEEMAKYHRRLWSTLACGDSLVRDFTVLTDRFSVIDQRVSLCITENGNGWAVVTLMDTGRDLYYSAPGPWSHPNHEKPSSPLQVTVLPVIQHHPKMVFRKLGHGDFHDSAESHATRRPNLTQSTSHMPLDYSQLLASVDLLKRAKTSPLHALVPLFAHAAFSEVALINLVSDLIGQCTEPHSLEVYKQDNFERLHLYQAVLQRHADMLCRTIHSIRSLCDKADGVPSRIHLSADANERPKGSFHQQFPSAFSSTGILEDHEDLRERCLTLLSRIESAKTSEMNRAMLLESGRAIEQSERVKLLTLMATYILPLSCAASLFGMNFGVFGQGSLPVWWYFVLAVPLVLMTHVVCSWNIVPFGSAIWRRLRRRSKT